MGRKGTFRKTRETNLKKGASAQEDTPTQNGLSFATTFVCQLFVFLLI